MSAAALPAGTEQLALVAALRQRTDCAGASRLGLPHSGFFSRPVRTSARPRGTIDPMPRLKSIGWLLLVMSLLITLPPAADGQHRSASGPIARAAAKVIEEAVARQAGVDAEWSRATALLARGGDVRAHLEDDVVRGSFILADDASITLQVNGTGRRLMREQVRRLAMATASRPKRHERIGAIVGGITGTVLIARHCKGQSMSSPCWEEMMLYVGGPMIAGAAIGHWVAKRVSWRQIYVRNGSARPE
jgi:hypothetical protein